MQCSAVQLCPGLGHTSSTTLRWVLLGPEHKGTLQIHAQTLLRSMEERHHSYREKKLCKSLFSALLPPFFSLTYPAIGIQRHSDVCTLLLCRSGFALCGAAMSCEHCTLHSGAGAALPSSCSLAVDPKCSRLHATSKQSCSAIACV